MGSEYPVTTAAAPILSRHANQAELVEAARAAFVNTVVGIQNGTIASDYSDGFARVVLTGGGAGTALLTALGRDFGAIDWQRVLVFFGDERFVPIDSTDRNAGAAHTELLDVVGIPADHIFEFDPATGENTPEEVAAKYAEIVSKRAPKGFDLHLLGMGGEGHINSLFPHTAEIEEEHALVVAVHDCPKPPATRVSLTMPAIASAHQVWLLVSGAEKAQAVAAIVAGKPAVEWPAAGVRGKTGTVVFVDEAASTLV